MTKVGSWDEHNKGLWAFTECPKLGTDDEGSIRLALRRSKASFWPPVSGSKDCCFIRLPLEFRQSYVMAWVVGTVIYAWMLWCFIEKGYMQVCFMLCSLRPYICKKLDNIICQSTRGCPWVSFSECGPSSLTTGAQRGVRSSRWILNKDLAEAR